MNGWKRLAFAIIEQACIDYATSVRAIERLKKQNPSSSEEISIHEDEIRRIERFIRSPMFEAYCNIDPEGFITLLRQRGGKRNNKVLL